MATSNACWGVEVGAGGIKAVKLVLDGENVRVAEFANMPHKRVLSTPELNQDDAIRLALGAFVNQHDLSKARVAVSVPGHAAFARFAKLPPVEPKQIPKIVRFEAEQQIPFSLEEVEWDFQTFRSPDSPDVEVGIFAATKERIRQQLQLYDDFGMVPDIVTLSPIAAYNALAYDLVFDERTPGTVIVDVGTTSTDLIIAEAGRVWVRTFPLGGNNFTQEIVDKFSVSYPKAEKIKREVHKSKSARHVLQALRPIFSDLGQEIQRSIGYYQSLHSDSDLQRVIGLGSTFELQGIRKALQQQVQLTVYTVEEFKRAKFDGVDEATLGENAGQLMTAYGLALQGLEFATLEANMMPAAVVREAVWRRKTPWFAAAAGLGLVAGAAMFIRPFMDQAAVDAYPQPPVIQQVLSRGESLKSDASGVTGSQVIDRTLSNLVALADGREVYAWLVNDISLMMERANTVAQGDVGVTMEMPAIHIQSLETSYAGTANPEVDPFSGGSQDDDAPENPQISVKLVGWTDHPDANNFIVDSVDRWLRTNQEREGVPYKLVLPSTAWRITQQFGSTAEAGEPAGGAITPPPDRQREAGRPTRPGRSGQARPPRGRGQPSDVMITGGGSETSAPVPMGTGPGNDLSTTTPGLSDLSNTYPIPRPDLSVPAGQTRSFFEVTWIMELVDEQEGGLR
ncbi:MAG: type IV pilus assembly protein PilM [Phycisphaerales bacterium]|jgi:type IV pilus assembly protein PilM